MRCVPLSEAALWFKRELETLGKQDDFLPDFEHGVCVELISDSVSDANRVARYLAKLGLELTGIATKTGENGHFTSWDIARAAAAGDERFAELWKEHARCMLGTRQLTWSRGLRAYAGLLPERTDEEIATDPLAPYEAERFLGSIPGQLWDARAHTIGQALVAELFEAYANNLTQAHPLVTPRDGGRVVNLSPCPALTYWERWRADAEARERGRDRLPQKPKVGECESVPTSTQSFRNADELRNVFAIDHNIGKGSG